MKEQIIKLFEDRTGWKRIFKGGAIYAYENPQGGYSYFSNNFDKALLEFTIELLSEAVEVMELMHSLDNWDDAYRHLAEYLTKIKEK